MLHIQRYVTVDNCSLCKLGVKLGVLGGKKTVTAKFTKKSEEK